MPSRISFKIATGGGNNSWTCPITCEQCTFIKQNGQPCRNRVCHGSPWCWVHNRHAYGVKARVSTIAAAGKGLFATRAFEQDDWICPMICEHITLACLNDRYPGDTTGPYAETDVNNHIVDCACQRGIGSQANAKFRQDGLVQHVSRHNAITDFRHELGVQPVGIWLKARRAIPEGSEIFLWYGENQSANAYRLQHNHSTKRVTTPAHGIHPDTRPC